MVNPKIVGTASQLRCFRSTF